MSISAQAITGSDPAFETFRPFIVVGGVTDSGLVALGPVGLGVAMGAVPDYGAWSPGSVVHGRRGRVGGSAGDAVDPTDDRLGDATDWADRFLSDVDDAAGRTGPTVVSTPLFGRQ